MSFENPTSFEKIGFRIEWTLSGSLIVPYLRRLHLRGDETLLEIGCGGGAVTRQLARRLPEGRVVGVDPSEYWVNYAARRLANHRNVALHAGDVLTANLHTDAFDAALFHFVLHDIRAAERPSTLSRIYDVLKDKGTLFVREPIKESHGMPAAAAQSMIASAGFIEMRSEVRKAFLFGACFEGVFRKA